MLFQEGWKRRFCIISALTLQVTCRMSLDLWFVVGFVAYVMENSGSDSSMGM